MVKTPARLPAKVGAAGKRLDELGTAKIGIPNSRPCQHGFLQDRILEIDLRKVALAQVGALQIGTLQVLTTQNEALLVTSGPVVGVLVAAGDGQHAKAQYLGQAMGDQRRIAPVPEAIGQKIGETDAAFRLAQKHQAAVRGDQATVECRRHLLATDGWKIEGKKAIVGHGGCGKSVVRFERRLGNDFLRDFNELRYARYPISRPAVNNARWLSSPHIEEPIVAAVGVDPVRMEGLERYLGGPLRCDYVPKPGGAVARRPSQQKATLNLRKGVALEAATDPVAYVSRGPLQHVTDVIGLATSQRRFL